jgi:cell division protein FtsQ
MYRLNRLWLTPAFRTFMRVGLPLVLIIAAGVAFFSNPSRLDDLNDKVAEIRRSIEERPEFMVKVMAIDGASRLLADDIRSVIPVDLPLSSFDLDLEQMREEVEGLDAVAKADLRIRSGGILQLSVTERDPAIVWRSPEGLSLLDAEGHRTAPIGMRAERPDLPFIVGEGADRAVPEALDLITRAEPIIDDVMGLVRISEMRWDVVLVSGQRIMLPELEPGAALDRVMAMNEAQDLLARDIPRIDIRNAKRPTLQLSQTALSTLRSLRGIPVKED